MLSYSINATKILKQNEFAIHSFVSQEENNIDWGTVDSFGSEWKKFNSFQESELKQIGNDYFDLVDDKVVTPDSLALDVGCGSGRWARYLANRVKFIEAIDPSQAVVSACAYLHDKKNVRVSQASVDNIPFSDASFDFVYSLGVLHHLPDTHQAIGKCRAKLKPQGWLLLYLYYALDNRSIFYKMLFGISTFFRKIISRLPQRLKYAVCDFIAATVYYPVARVCGVLYRIRFLQKLTEAIPLSYYRKTSFHVMRNDALDRFGTPLEKRFTKVEIENMLILHGFVNIRFSNNPPYWHVIAQRPK